MWINESGQVFRAHHEIRASLPNVSMPAVITDAALDGLGFLPVTQVAQPTHDPLMQAVTEAAPALINGTWTQQWVVRALSQAEQDAAWAASVPQVVSMRQARLALLAAGKLDAVATAIAAQSEPLKTAAQITWEYSTEVQRDFGLVAQLAPALGLTDRQVDELFIAAAQL